jgi:hypothetical protein
MTTALLGLVWGHLMASAWGRWRSGHPEMALVHMAAAAIVFWVIFLGMPAEAPG